MSNSYYLVNTENNTVFELFSSKCEGQHQFIMNLLMWLDAVSHLNLTKQQLLDTIISSKYPFHKPPELYTIDIIQKI